MSASKENIINEVLNKQEQAILEDWLKEQLSASTLRPDLLDNKELQQTSRDFLELLKRSLQLGQFNDITDTQFTHMLQFLNELSANRATQGFSPTETATFIFSLKQPLFSRLSELTNIDDEKIKETIWTVNILLDKLGLYTMEQFLTAREDVISRQQQDMLELSTPVVKLWEGILVLPLIGTLDSMRTQQVMESLLQKIVDTNASVAIIDITGIPMVDTLVAQHLIKTINAARLMGSECIVSGIRPQIAQTIVHLGISLQEVTTRATLADAVNVALRKAGFSLTRLS